MNRIVKTFYDEASIGARCVKNHKILITPQAVSYMSKNSYFGCEPFNFTLSSNLSQPSLNVFNELNSVNYTYSKCSLSCDCGSGFPSCPASGGGDINYRNIKTLKTSDLVYDLTSRNTTDWLIKTELSKQFFQKRYGGFEFQPPLLNNSIDQLSNFSASLINFISSYSTLFNSSSININSINQTIRNISNNAGDPIISNQNIKIWYNSKGNNSSSVSYLNVINNAILRSQINKLNEEGKMYLDPSEHAIVAYNHPMPFSVYDALNLLQKKLLTDLFVAVCIIFGKFFSFLS